MGPRRKIADLQVSMVFVVVRVFCVSACSFGYLALIGRADSSRHWRLIIMAQQTLTVKVAVIPGGDNTLCGLLSRKYAQSGGRVVVHYHGDVAAANETVQAVQQAGSEATAVQGDLTEQANVRRLFDVAVDSFGGVDVAVNTTGMFLR